MSLLNNVTLQMVNLQLIPELENNVNSLICGSI